MRPGDGTSWVPVAPDDLPALLADRIASLPGVVRVAIDGALCAGPDVLADAIVEPLRVLGRPVEHVRAARFWRAASLRLEWGREDVESFALWLDDGALRREVLDAAREKGTILPSLRDPVTDRSTREPVRTVTERSVVVVSGELLLGRALPFDLVVHLALSPAALARRLDPPLAWTLPAYADYDTTVRPSEVADMVVRVDDARHPALRSASGGAR